jgi:hypothetical protein
MATINIRGEKHMKKKWSVPVFLFFFLWLALLIFGQFTPSELAQREEIEEFLKTAEIVNVEKVGEGVTIPRRVYLKAGDKEGSGVWKNPKGVEQGYLEGWQYEIAAYEMDKLLGLNMIPPTVERKLGKKSGSLQFWLEDMFSDLDRAKKKMEIPRDKLLSWSKNKYISRAFDSLIGNEDRTQQNILYTQDWRMILIDHSRSFRSTWQFRVRLIFGKYGIQGAKLFRQLPREFVEKIRGLDFDTIKAAVGPYLKNNEIDSILKRKELLLKEIDEMIQELGENQVLY